MAYKNKADYYTKQAQHEGSFSPRSFMMQTLSDKYSPESLESSFACEAAEKLLATAAKKHDMKSGINKPIEEYISTARTAIVDFCNNHATNQEEHTGSRFEQPVLDRLSRSYG